MQAASVILRAASNKKSRLLDALPGDWPGHSTALSAPCCSKTTTDGYDHEGGSPSVPTTGPLIATQSEQEADRPRGSSLQGTQICNSIAISPFTWSLKSSSFQQQAKTKEEVFFGVAAGHIALNGEGGAGA